MSVLIKIIQFILSLSLIVVIHELGHFLFAKYFKTRVEKFYLFFDAWFALFKFKKGETEYGIGWLPLGGYVKISGMIDESMDLEQMKQPPQPYEFRSKPSWQRLLIMVGGVLFNLILAMLIFVSILFTWGETYLPTSSVKYGIVTDSIGKSIGLQNGDKIISVDNVPVEDFMTLSYDILLNMRQTIQIDRDGERLNIDIPKEYIPQLVKGKGLISYREPFNAMKVVSFSEDSPAQSAGLLKDDEIIGIDSLTFEYRDEFQAYLVKNAENPVVVNAIRAGENKDITISPDKNGLLGIHFEGTKALSEIFELKTINYGFFESIPVGIAKGFSTITDYLKQFKLIFSKEVKGYESVGGFITIANIFPEMWNWQIFWERTALLSIILAVMNILPIPLLDGGHVMFLLYEVVTGRKPSDKFLEYAQIVGMVIVFSLLILANGNDILRLIRK